MFDLVVQLAGQGASPVQTKPENTARNNGDAPETAVFGDLLSKASKARQGEAPEKTEPVFNPANTVGVTASGKDEAGEKAKGTELAAQVQEASQVGLPIQLPEQAADNVELPENAVPEEAEAETDIENADTADVNTQPGAEKENGPQANGLNEHSSARAHEVIAALQNKTPLPEEQGTLAGNDASVDDIDGESQDVSVTVNAKGTDATGLTDENNNQIADETASWEQPAAQNAGPSETQQAAAETVAAAREMVYHPVFEAPRNNLGKTESDYASRPERPALAKTVLQTGLLAQVKPQQAPPEISAGSAPQQQAAPIRELVPQPAQQPEQSAAESFKPSEITFAAGHVQPLNTLKEGKPVSGNAAMPDSPAFDAGFETALSTQAETGDSAAGMDLGGKTFEALASAGDNFAEASAENAALFESVSIESVSAGTDTVAARDASGSGLSQSALAAGVKAPDTAIPVFTSSAHSVADQVVEATQYGVQNGQKALVLKLNPDNLGEVRLHLSSNAQQAVSAKLIVSSFETHDALNQQINSLKQSLESQGLQVGKISVVMAGGSEFGANAGHGNGQQQHASTHQDGGAQNFWSSLNQNGSQQQGNFNQNAQQMFNQMMNNSSGGGLSYGGYGNAPSQQQAIDPVSTPQNDADAAWGTPHDNQTHANGRVSLLV